MKIKVAAGIVVVGVIAALTMHYLAQTKLQPQNETLQQQTNQLTQSQAENQRPSNQLAESNKSAATTTEQSNAVAQTMTAESAAMTNSIAVNPSALPVSETNENELPKNSWTNAGFSTPEATLQTRGWSVLNGDRDAFKQSVHITDDARKFAEDQFIKMAEASNDPNKAQYIQDILDNKLGVEEAILMPMMAANQNNPFTGYKILSEKSPSADEMILQVETETASAPARTETLDFQRFGADWKVVYDKATIQNMMQSH